MFIRKNLTLFQLIRFTWYHLIWMTIWGAFVVSMYSVFHVRWISIPWLPISVIGIATSFFVGFKANSSYDRLWEARKIWGSIVNNSRKWASTVKVYIHDENLSNEALMVHKKRLIKRQVAWLYALRSQLLQPATWEHTEATFGVGKMNTARKRRTLDLFNNDDVEFLLRKYMTEECESIIPKTNAATHILDKNAQDLLSLKKLGLLSDYRHVELQNLINQLYDDQGQCERIKKFPFPRQYATGSLYFIGIFILLLPFGMITEFEKLNQVSIWLTVPFVSLVGWVFILMELIGDYSENPFGGLPNDVPMLSLCRTIEIDLLEMIGEEDISPPIEPQGSLLL